MDLAEYATLVGLGVGSVASFVSSQVLYTSAPLSLMVLLNLANRNRLEQQTETSVSRALQDIDERVSTQVELLNQQLAAMPTPEAMGSLRRSLLTKQRDMAEHLSSEIQALQHDMQQRVGVLEHLNLPNALREVDSLREQYGQISEGMAQVTTRLNQLSSSARVDDLERAIAQLRTDAAALKTNLQTLTDQTRPALNSLQDQIAHLNRQFQKLPPPFDSTALQQNVAELIRMVGDSAPKRELASLVAQIKELHQQQESQAQAEEILRRNLHEINQQLQTRPTRSSLTYLQYQINTLSQQFQQLPSPFDSSSLKREMAKLLQLVAERVPQRDFSGLVAQVKALQEQQAFHAQIEKTLKQELQVLNQQLQTVLRQVESGTPPPALPEASAVSAQHDFQARLEALLQREFEQIHHQLQHLPTGADFRAQVKATLHQELRALNQQLQSFSDGPHYAFVVDFADAQPGLTQTDGLQTSRGVLEEALNTTQERLIVMLPWSSQCWVDDALAAKMDAYLSQQRRLNIGWCYQADRQEERLLNAINQRWQIHASHPEALQTTLQALLRLKRAYPTQFQFSVLGMRETFLVSDDRFAVLSVDESVLGETVLPGTELKLRTTDADVIQELIERFDQPVIDPYDVVAYWNRAVTRFELGDKAGALADFDQIMLVSPEDAIAYNYRGVVRYELDDWQGAIADFNRSIELHPHQIAAYCNRGYIRSELGNQFGAIDDFTAAIRVRPDAAVAHFFRGIAHQKSSKLDNALDDYSSAIGFAPQCPTAYYYRGLTRPKVNDYHGAIADLERALDLFAEWGHEANARKVFNHLSKLQTFVDNMPASRLYSLEMRDRPQSVQPAPFAMRTVDVAATQPDPDGSDEITQVLY